MKIHLDKNNRVNGFTSDPLVTSYALLVDDESLPIDFRKNALDYKVDGGVLVYDPQNETDEVVITILGITGNISNTDNFSVISGYELTDMMLTGTMDVPDGTYPLAISRDDGRKFFFEATVNEGVLTLDLNFPTTGEFTYTDEEANYLSESVVYTVSDIKFTIIRKTSNL